MATSQNLRPGNLVDSVKSYLTSDVVRSASTLVGEPESPTSHALHGAVPSLLGGLLNFSSSNEGANSLAGMIRDGGYGSLLGNPSSLFTGGGVTSGMMSNGQSLISKIFGNRASSVSSAIASSSGVKPESAGTLMSLLAPLTLGVVGKMAGSQGLNAAGITNLLTGQKREIGDAAPLEVSHILGFGGGPVAAPAASATYVHEEKTAPTTPAPSAMYVHEERTTAPHPSALYEERAAPRSRNWLPLLLLGLAILGLLGYLLSRGRTPTANVAPPAPVAANPPAPSPPAPAPAPASPAPLPGPSNVYFENASTQLTQDSTQIVNNFAATMKAHPDAQIQVEGHTDNVGNPQANQQLSLARANAVKAMLVSDGIDANRISTAGYGQDRPVASNDTEEGRARNRRTELIATSR